MSVDELLDQLLANEAAVQRLADAFADRILQRIDSHSGATGVTEASMSGPLTTSAVFSCNTS